MARIRRLRLGSPSHIGVYRPLATGDNRWQRTPVGVGLYRDEAPALRPGSLICPPSPGLQAAFLFSAVLGRAIGSSPVLPLEPRKLLGFPHIDGGDGARFPQEVTDHGLHGTIFRGSDGLHAMGQYAGIPPLQHIAQALVMAF